MSWRMLWGIDRRQPHAPGDFFTKTELFNSTASLFTFDVTVCTNIRANRKLVFWEPGSEVSRTGPRTGHLMTSAQ